MTPAIDLESGDLIEIKYRVSRMTAGGEEAFDRWIGAEIIDCEPDAWPLARLTDGQLTDVRPFMEWRVIPGGRRQSWKAA